MAVADLNSVALSRLDDAHMAALERCSGATLKHCGSGEKLIEVGERGFKFFVVKNDNEINLVAPTGHAHTCGIQVRGFIAR
jgi:hypothetical protein